MGFFKALKITAKVGKAFYENYYKPMKELDEAMQPIKEFIEERKQLKKENIQKEQKMPEAEEEHTRKQGMTGP